MWWGGGRWMVNLTPRSLYPRVREAVEASWNVMAHEQEPDFVFRAKRTRPFKSAGGRQFSRLLAAEGCASAVVMLDTPCSDIVWRVLATHFIRQFPLHFPSLASPCAITFQLESTHCTEGRVGPRAGLDWRGKISLPHRDSIPRLSPLNESPDVRLEAYIEGYTTYFDTSKGIVAIVTLLSSGRLTSTLTLWRLTTPIVVVPHR